MSNYRIPEPQFEETILKQEMYHVQKILSDLELRGVRVDFRKDLEYVVGGMAIQMRRALYHRDDPKEIMVPVTWWDHIKAGIVAHPWCPVWLHRRIKIGVTRYVARQAFPEFVPPSMGPAVMYFARMGEGA